MRYVTTLPKRFTCFSLVTKGPAKKIVAFLIVAATLNVGLAVASPTMQARPLTGLIRIGGMVTLNGQRANPGQTIFSGSTITTERQAWSTISLENSSRFKLNEATAINLEFSPSGVLGLLSDGEMEGFVPTGLGAEIKTADALVFNNPAQPATFVIRADACNTKVSVHTGQVEVRAWDRMQSVRAGESFSTAEQFPTPPQQNLSQRKRIGLIIGIGATLGVLLIALMGQDHKTPDDRPGSVCAPSGESGC
jgi:ferric-dicitrate binding protein FerR (iron transport regulator)